MVEGLLAREQERGIPSERIVLAGFSQGGAMAVYCGLRLARPLAGIMGLSTYLLMAQELAAERSDANAGTGFGMLSMFSGGAVERLSIISLGIMPYITASIVMELLAATFPALGQMKKERDGMQKYMQIIRYFTIFITVVQAIGVSMGLQSMTGRAGHARLA